MQKKVAEPFQPPAPLDNQELHDMQGNDALSVEDLNKLFLSDDWKEPDWKTYDPYNPEKIDVPSPEDFKGEDLPQFGDAARPPEPKSLPEEKILEPEEPFAEKSNSAIKPIVKPIELYIRGSAYSKVFIELNQMSKALSRIDAQTENYEEMVKREEPLFTLAKEQMEYAYRRLSLIDKKIFVQ
jgi:hypothetical protein